MDPSYQELGELWRQTFYQAILESLGFDEKRDLVSRDFLYDLLSGEGAGSQLAEIDSKIRGKEVIIFGAGPSLEYDLKGLKDYLAEKHPVTVAADGAADALSKAGLTADLVISDLDSCSVDTLKRVSETGHVFVHAHGDNLEQVRTIVPKINSRNVFGTTQTASRGFIRNFGGFTDGDSCLLYHGKFRTFKVPTSRNGFQRKRRELFRKQVQPIQKSQKGDQAGLGNKVPRVSNIYVPFFAVQKCNPIWRGDKRSSQNKILGAQLSSFVTLLTIAAVISEVLALPPRS